MAEHSEMDSADDRDAVRWSTVFAEGTWVAAALLVLAAREMALARFDPDEDLFLTVASVMACVTALAVVTKDKLVTSRWILPLNIVAVIFALLFLGGMIVEGSALPPLLYAF